MTKLSHRRFMHFAAIAAGPTNASAAWAQTCGYRAAVGAARAAVPARREKSVMRTVIIAAVGAAALFSSPAFTQEPSQGTTSIPDFSELWAHPYTGFGFEPPASGPGPVTNKSRLRNGVSNPSQLVGDYTNPILKPLAAEVVKRRGEIELSGRMAPNPDNQCWPEPLPYVLSNASTQVLQQPHEITILYDQNSDVRLVRMNEPHPAHVTRSWYGDSVGRYEGDTLVIDTVGIRTDRPFAMVDYFGTPYTEALHVVERYRLLDYETAKEALERNAKENFDYGGTRTIGDAPLHIDPNYRGKHLQLAFTVEDEGVFTTPWSATITYRPGFNWLGAAEWPEVICAENNLSSDGKDEAVPRAHRPDF
jgi:hypothetical protein